MFVLGPLVGLLLVSRPSTGREWFWLVAGSVIIVMSLAGGGGLAGGFIQAAGVLVSGAFVALSLWRPHRLFTRAAAATMIGLGAALFWSAILGAGWDDVERALARETRDTFLAQARLAEAQEFSSLAGTLREMADGAALTAAFYPALIALTAMGGAALAWRWYHRVAVRPLGEEGGPFGNFRFSDQAVWLLAGGLAILLLPGSDVGVLGVPLSTWAMNLLAVAAALYVARGLAVFLAASRRTPRRIVAVLGVVSLLLWPFAVGGLVLLGLADSWVDFRRRLESPPTGGTN